MRPRREPFRVVVRGVFRLAGGRAITRTVVRDGERDHADEEAPFVAHYELVEELRTAGHHFAEGRAVLVEELGTLHEWRDRGELAAVYRYEEWPPV